MFKVPELGKTQVYCKKYPGADEQHHKPDMASEIAVKYSKKVVQLMHVTNIKIFILATGTA